MVSSTSLGLEILNCPGMMDLGGSTRRVVRKRVTLTVPDKRYTVSLMPFVRKNSTCEEVEALPEDRHWEWDIVMGSERTETGRCNREDNDCVRHLNMKVRK